MSLLQKLSEILMGLVQPWIFMAFSIPHIPATVRQILASSSPLLILSPVHFRDVLFGNFWSEVGPEVKGNAELRVIPLLEGRVKEGKVHPEAVHPPVSGTVIEVGAGSGLWMDVFSKINTGGGPGITKIYGVEPNIMSAAALTQRVKDLNMESVYEVVPVGIESVDDSTKWNGRIPPGSVDCIVCILCLCSIPEPEKNIALLYRLLKPGGRWYVYEHVRCTQGGLPLRLYQSFVNFFWAFFLGSCRIVRPTGEIMKAVGPWETYDVTAPPDAPWYQVLPHVIGIWTKKVTN